MVKDRITEERTPLKIYWSPWSLLIASVLAVLPLSPTLYAQDETPTAVTDQNRSGDLPFSETVGSDVEHVVLSTGNLVVNIPIADIPGRGGHFYFGLRYDGRYLVTSLRGSNYIWNIERANYLPSNGLWQADIPLLTYSTYSKTTCGPNITGQINGENNFIYTDRDGGKHLVQTGREIGQCGVSEGSWSYTNRGPDTTGAGIWAGMLAVGHSQTSPGPAGLFLADGSQPGYSSTNGYDPVTSTIQFVLGTIQDPNGNAQSEFSGGDDTLGRVAITEQDPTSQILYTIKDSSGTASVYTVNLENLAIKTAFAISGVQEYSATRSVIRSIVLPNGREYSFSYDAYGSLTELTLPTGGVVSYTWGNFDQGVGTYRYVTSRTVTVGSQVSKWTFLQGATAQPCAFPNPNSGCMPMTVTDPLGNQSVYLVSVGITAVARIYAGAATGTPLRQYTIAYTDANLEDLGGNLWLPTKITTQLETGQVAEKDYQYDSFTYTNYSCGTYTLCAQSGPGGSTVHTSRGNVTDIKEYDWGQGAPGPLLRHETKTYLHDSNPSYLNANIVDKVLVDTTYNGSGTQVAQTKYQYDNYTGSTAMVSTSGVPQHNYTNFSTANIYRGNVTQLERWLNTNSSFLTTAYKYDDLGNIRTITDPAGNPTTWSYNDSWANSSCPPPSNSMAFATQRTNALGQLIQFTYFPCTGLKQSRKDQNDINAGRAGTTWTYDLLDRLLTETRSDTGITSYAYNDTPPVSVTTSKSISSSVNLVSTSTEDGLGRTTQTDLTSDPEGAVLVDTTYDLLGRKETVTNPYRSTGDPTYGVTTFGYDALSRPTSVTDADGSASHTSYCGSSTLATDEAGKWRRTAADGLGRLIEVDEPNAPGATATACSASAANVTTYGHDALGDLTSVSQAASRQRSFAYDSLSRLTSSTNPESGKISYTYDANSNVLTKTALAPNQPSTGTATVTTTYLYDALNRLTKKTYSDNTTPTVNFLYDTSANWGTVSQTNLVGRLSEEWTVAGTVAYSGSIFGYDSTGRTVLNDQCTPLTCGPTNYPVGYTYDVLGDMTSYANGAGQMFTQAFDSAGRVTSLTSNVVDAQHPATLATVTQFFPSGAPELLNYGNNIHEIRFLNNRLQTCRINIDTNATAPVSILHCADNMNYTTLQDFYLQYNEGSSDNGNVSLWKSAYNQVFNRTYAYDQVNRLTSMSDADTVATCQGASWTYDTWGNRLTQTPTKGSCGMWNQGYDTTNRITGWSYDAAGNLLNDHSHSYTYDAENRITAVDGGATATYLYDAEGRRVEKKIGSVARDYVYNLSGQAVAEMGSAGLDFAHIYLGGSLVAEYENATTYFIHRDHLGSTRLMTQMNGTAYDSLDFMPFGEQILGDTATNRKFTGKERDAESNLDNFGARYNSSQMGRFLSPDWSGNADPVPYADFANPQSLNLYSYVKNNPLSTTDTQGHCPDGNCVIDASLGSPSLSQVGNFAIGAGKFLVNAVTSTANTLALSDMGIPIPQLTSSNDSQTAGMVVTGVVTVVVAAADAIEGLAGASESTATGATASREASTSLPDSIEATGPGRPNASQQGAVNEIGDRTGCHTCGTASPGTKSGNWVADHQPPSALNTSGGKQVLKPQCLQCSRQQGGQVAAAVKAAKRPKVPFTGQKF